MTLHKIQNGETLSQIAKEYNTTVKDIAEKNNIENPNSIMVGTTIEVGENISNFDNYESASKEKSNDTLKYTLIGGSILPFTGHVIGASLGKFKEKASSLTPEERKEAKENITNKTKSYAKGALIGTAVFPGLGSIVGGIIGWLKG